MNDLADNLMLTGVVRPCPDCADERIFVAPDTLHEASAGADFACTDCGAALLIDPCLFLDPGRFLEKGLFLDEAAAADLGCPEPVLSQAG